MATFLHPTEGVGLTPFFCVCLFRMQSLHFAWKNFGAGRTSNAF